MQPSPSLRNRARFKAFFFKNKIYPNIRNDIPLRIVVGHKGIGKSALLRMSYLEDLDDANLALWLRPGDVFPAYSSSDSFLDRIEKVKRHILDKIYKLSLERLEIFESSVDQSIAIESAKSILAGLQKKVFEWSGADVNSEAQRQRKKFQNKKEITIYIDDIDRGWEASDADRKNLSALINAARDLSNDEDKLKFRIGLRTDAYNLFRSSDESTDKVHGNVVKVSWTNHDILVVMALRVAKYFNDASNSDYFASLPQHEIARALHRVIVPKFQGRGHWDNAPIHRVLLSLTRQRPRDLIILLRLAAQQAFREDHKQVKSKDLEDIFSEYSQGRLNDIIVEYKSELPQIERLVKNMGPTSHRRGHAKKNFQYSNDELIKKLNNIKSNHSLAFSNRQPVTARSLAEFLYKIDFIRARNETSEGVVWTHYDQNPNLMSQIVDFGYHWEVHPAYRWALNPKDVTKILEEMDNALT